MFFIKWHSFKIENEANTLFMPQCFARKNQDSLLNTFIQGPWFNLIIKNDGWY